MFKKRHATEFRYAQIAEAALDIVRRRGVGGLSVAAVAAEVDIVPSAVYRHYKNKSEIVTAVLDLIHARLNANYQAVIQQHLAPLDKLKSLLQQHVDLIKANSAIPRIIFSGEVIGGEPEKRQQLYGIIQDVIHNVAMIVEEGQHQELIRRDIPPRNIALSFLGIFQPATIIWSLSGGEFDLLQHCENAWKLFLDAIRVPPDDTVKTRLWRGQ